MLRVESSDFVSYTEFEEGIHFDEDDPDFARQQDVMPSISLPLVLRVPTKMSLAGVHPAEVHSTHGSMTTLSHSLDDISGWPQMQTGGGNDHVLTIEELRLQLSSCFTCGVSWVEHHVSLDCSECGGYALERPCPRCDGHCGATWKRDLTMSHACGKARWQGECTYNNCTCPQNAQEPATNTNSKTSAPANNALAQELCSRLEKLSATS